MPASAFACVAAVALAATGHLAAEARGAAVARAVLKVTASAAFVALAALVAAGGRYAGLVLAGLALSALGDALLLASAPRAFLAGIGAFLLAHLAYAAAFAPATHPSPTIAVAFAAAGCAVVRWLWPHLGHLRGPVVVYAAAITAMVVLALGVPAAAVRVGAALFYLSDLAVARDRFVRPGIANRLVGLPLYYAAQVLIALSTAFPEAG